MTETSDNSTEPTRLKTRLHGRYRNFRERYAKYDKYFPAGFFVGGFIFDILTLSRVDDWFGLGQQIVYILFIWQVLRYRTLEAAGAWQPGPRVAKFWQYNDEALHFVLGSLLSLYTLFYFVSSSLATSFVFLLIIFGLLVANEVPGFQKRGLVLKYALFAMCYFSFSFILVALTLGFVGVVPFLLGLTFGLVSIFFIYKNVQARMIASGVQETPLQLMERMRLNQLQNKLRQVHESAAQVLSGRSAAPPEATIENADAPPSPTAPTGAEPPPAVYDLKKIIFGPAVVVAVLLTGLYIFKLLPPIPLSIQYMGIYHQVEKVKPAGATGDTQFILKYDRPFWRFWQHGAQTFVAEPGDKINCFVRIFAPANFRDEIIYHWLKKDGAGYWRSADRVRAEITGGRVEGFRGVATKANYEPGEWRVQVETTDGREIGRIDLTVSLEETKNLVREFRVDHF